MIKLRLDQSSPTPLYHQIVQALRFRIGTGVLRPGDALPPIRDAAIEWRVNYHTVRRAYHELAVAGWVESAPGSGTRVSLMQPSAETGRGGIDEWLDEVLATAETQYGVSGEALAELIRERQRSYRLVMVECNQHQASCLARKIEAELPVEAIAWSLESPGEPPNVPIIGTYFHHGEMRNRWPHRMADMHFVAVTTDRTLEQRIAGIAARRGVRRVWLVERDIGTAHEMATAVSAVLPARYEVRPVVGDPVELFGSLQEEEILLVAPRFWDDLPEEVRDDERVFDVEPTIVSGDLQRIWRSLKAAAVDSAPV